MSRADSWLRSLGLAGGVSLLSLAFAWSAIGLAVAGQLRASVLCALAAFIFDLLDGFVARTRNSASEFGRVLDSMVDLVNYSFYAAVLTAFYLAPGVLGWAVGFVIVATGTLRLVRFSVEGFDQDGPVKYYRGLLVCHVSLAAIVLLLAREFSDDLAWPSALVLIVLSVLQLSRIRIRKTGRQVFWASLVVPLAVGAFLWLT